MRPAKILLFYLIEEFIFPQLFLLHSADQNILCMLEFIVRMH